MRFDEPPRRRWAALPALNESDAKGAFFASPWDTMPLERRIRQRHLSATLTALALWFASPNLSAELLGTQPGEVPADGFVDADYCGQCHGGGIDGDYSFLPTDTWAGTMMANAARDPVFFAALTIANQDMPGVGTYCLRCHTPLGFVRNHAAPPDGSVLDEIDKQGVGCDVCHRATQTAGPDGPYLLSDAQIVFTADTSKRGPYEGATSPVHDTVQDDGLSNPRFCGQCHYVTNPLRKLRNQEG
ncbi:MAG TPA: multiheme c-type cytochrome, partial [Polyangium sp.]|nr:multiheme c-type cytochrome [Polyangium sp.]